MWQGNKRYDWTYAISGLFLSTLRYVFSPQPGIRLAQENKINDDVCRASFVQQQHCVPLTSAASRVSGSSDYLGRCAVLLPSTLLSRRVARPAMGPRPQSLRPRGPRLLCGAPRGRSDCSSGRSWGRCPPGAVRPWSRTLWRSGTRPVRSGGGSRPAGGGRATRGARATSGTCHWKDVGKTRSYIQHKMAGDVVLYVTSLTAPTAVRFLRMTRGTYKIRREAGFRIFM